MNKIAIVDVDDTVLPLVEEVLRWYNLDTDEGILKSDIKDWNIGSFVKDGNKLCGYFGNPNLYNNIKPVYMALWGITNLRKMGFRVVFATSCAKGSEGRKFKWLNDNKFNVKEEDYVELKDKSLLNGDLIIDDNYKNVMNFKGFGILVSQDWNEKYEYPFRSHSWVETIKMVKEFTEGKNIYES